MRCLIAIFICVSLVLRFTEVSEVTWLPRFLPRDEEHKLRNKESEEDTLSFFDCVLTTFSSLFDSLDIRHHFAENDRRERRKRKEHKFRQFIIIRISVCLSVHIFFEWRQRSWVGKHWKEKSIKHKFFFHDRKEKHALLFSVINFLWLKYACAWKSKLFSDLYVWLPVYFLSMKCLIALLTKSLPPAVVTLIMIHREQKHFKRRIIYNQRENFYCLSVCFIS